MAKKYRNSGEPVKYVVLAFSGEEPLGTLAWPEVFGLTDGEALTKAQAEILKRSLQDMYPDSVFLVSPVHNAPIPRHWLVAGKI